MAAVDLAAVLGVPLDEVAYLDALSDEQQVELLALVEATRTQNRSDVLASVDTTAEHLPRLLRGQFRKLFK